MEELIRCPRCKQELPPSAFFWNRKQRNSEERGRSQYCKECERAKARATYKRIKAKPDGVRYNRFFGRCMEKHGQSMKLYWSEPMLETLRKRFPTSNTDELAIDLGVCIRTVQNKAKELGLKKDPTYRHKVLLNNLKQANLMAKITKRTSKNK